MCEKRVMGKISWSKGEQVTGDPRRVYREELQNLCCSPNIWIIKSRRMRWAEHVAYMGEERYAYRVLVGKPEGKSTWKT
jgi:hypothetical protein